MYDLGICPMCTVVNVESGGPRQILATDFFVAIAPWAPSHSYEFWIFPKKHQTSFLKATQREISDLAKILRCTLGGMSKALDGTSFNLVFHISSEKKTTRQIHWHIEVYPTKSRWGGIERGMGVFINPVCPEQVAEELGEYSRREFAHIIGIK
jgi:UDPglucose--hexose-1-phosphate uridylyltransferase